MKKGFLATRKPRRDGDGYGPQGAPPSPSPSAVASGPRLRALLDAGCVSAARRGAERVLRLEAQSPELLELLGAVTSQEAKALEEAERLERAPVEALLVLLRAGIENAAAWRKADKALEQSLAKFGAMLEELGVLKDGSLLRNCQALQDDGRQVLIFSSRDWHQAGVWTQLPAAFPACAAGVLRASQADPKAESSVRILRSACGKADPTELSEATWATVSHGDWLEVGALQQAPPAVQVEDWPAPRCVAELMCGSLPRMTFDEALQVIRWRPAVVSDAQLLNTAQRWSLDFLEDHVPRGHGASLFSVYRAREPQRRFRYAAQQSDEGEAYRLEGCAERLLLDFQDFARRKRAAEAKNGDGFAYYLWGVVLRRGEDGYEGFNCGPEVDEDLADGHSWEQLHRLQEAGQWGSFEQAQLFVGCRNALTPCHYDMLHNAYVQVKGWKRFLLMDPSYSSDLYAFPLGHPMDRCAQADLESPDFQRFPKLKNVRAVEAVLGPGDVLVLPCGWHHHVQSLTEDSLSVSFWFAPIRAPIEPLGSVERVLLMREVEAVLLLLFGARGLRGAFTTLRGMLQGELQDLKEALPCAWLLWRLRCALGSSVLARDLVRAMADDARLSQLQFQENMCGTSQTIKPNPNGMSNKWITAARITDVNHQYFFK
ncbi:unnamed protein product [Effrenium voratum]|nr:unnamed protein product [Effrenium voratum]